MDRHHVKPVVQVFAKAAGSALGQEVAVAGGDDTRVDANRLGVADAFELPLLQRSQQLHLQVRRRGVDFI